MHSMIYKKTHFWFDKCMLVKNGLKIKFATVLNKKSLRLEKKNMIRPKE